MANNEDILKWLKHIHSLYKNNDLNAISNNLFNKLDLLAYLHEELATKKIALKENENFLESLVIKFFLHGLSIHQMAKGFNINSNYFDKNTFSKNTFVDISSILTIGRAQMETLLMYHHLYLNTEDEDEQKLRYFSWIYSALIQRHRLPRRNELTKDVLENAEKEIKEFKDKILNCPAYNNLSENQKKSIIETGTPKSFKSWDKIFEESKFSKNGNFSKFYYILSSYAHSEGLSGMQLKASKYLLSGKNNQNWIRIQLMTSWIMTAIMIESIVGRFKIIEEAYQKIDEQTKFEIQFLSKLAKNDVSSV